MSEDIALLNTQVTIGPWLDHQDPPRVLGQTDVLEAICRVVYDEIKLPLS